MIKKNGPKAETAFNNFQKIYPILPNKIKKLIPDPKLWHPDIISKVQQILQNKTWLSPSLLLPKLGAIPASSSSPATSSVPPVSSSDNKSTPLTESVDESDDEPGGTGSGTGATTTANSSSAPPTLILSSGN